MRKWFNIQTSGNSFTALHLLPFVNKILQIELAEALRWCRWIMKGISRPYREMPQRFFAMLNPIDSHTIGQLAMRSVRSPAAVGCRWRYTMSQDRVEWSVLWVIVCNKVTSSEGQMMDWDINIPCHMDGSKQQYFLIMDNMTLDGFWDCNEESMGDRYYRN